MEEKMLEMMQTLTTTVLAMQKDMSDMKKDLNTRIDKLQGDIRQLKENDKAMQTDMKTMQGDMKAFRAGQEEQSRILGKLEQLALISAGNQDNQMYDIAQAQGDIVLIKEVLVEQAEVTLKKFPKAQ